MPGFCLPGARSFLLSASCDKGSKVQRDPNQEDALPYYTTTPQTPTEQANTVALRNLIYFMLASDYLFLESSGRPTVRSTWTRSDGQAPHPPMPTHSWWCKAYQDVNWRRWIKAAKIIELDRLGVIELSKPRTESLRLRRTAGLVVLETASHRGPPQYKADMPTTSRCRLSFQLRSRSRSDEDSMA